MDGKNTMTKKENKSTIPYHEIEALAECFLPFIREYYDSKEGQTEFDEWQNKQQGKHE